MTKRARGVCLMIVIKSQTPCRAQWSRNRGLGVVFGSFELPRLPLSNDDRKPFLSIPGNSVLQCHPSSRMFTLSKRIYWFTPFLTQLQFSFSDTSPFIPTPDGSLQDSFIMANLLTSLPSVIRFREQVLPDLQQVLTSTIGLAPHFRIPSRVPPRASTFGTIRTRSRLLLWIYGGSPCWYKETREYPTTPPQSASHPPA